MPGASSSRQSGSVGVRAVTERQLGQGCQPGHLGVSGERRGDLRGEIEDAARLLPRAGPATETTTRPSVDHAACAA